MFKRTITVNHIKDGFFNIIRYLRPQDTYRFKCHHSLKITDGTITKGMVHAFIDPEINK